MKLVMRPRLGIGAILRCFDNRLPHKEPPMRDARELLDRAGTEQRAGLKKILVEVMVKPAVQIQLARRAGCSPGLVADGLRELLRDGLVDRSRGDEVRLAPMRGVAVGIDIGAGHAYVVARRLDQQVEEASSRRRALDAGAGLRGLRRTVLAMVEEVVAEAGQAMADVVSAGLAIPRMVDARMGTLVKPVLPRWRQGEDPTRILSNELAVPVAVDNDANLGALAEHVYGSGNPVEHFVYVKASTTVGAGIVLGPHLLRGQRGMAGEIGHLTVEREGRMCLCGGRGCLDTVVGADALVAKAKEPHQGVDREHPATLAELIAKAHAGDAVCRRVLNDAGRALGFALAQLCNLLNPRRIVIGGELSTAGDMLLGPCDNELRRHALYSATNELADFGLELSALNPYAEAHGALVLGLRYWSTR